MQPSVKIPSSVDAEFAPRKFALGCGFPLSQMVWGICIYTPTAKWNIHGGRYGTPPEAHREASGRGA